MEGKSFLLKIKVSLKPKQMETLPVLINVFCFLFPLIDPPLSDYQELILFSILHITVRSIFIMSPYIMRNNYAFLLLAITNGYLNSPLSPSRQFPSRNFLPDNSYVILSNHRSAKLK